ncbi:MAG: nitroreductase family protein [Deltaproteobacteria bacterium]|nr:nitroreductase family protein [Deltaproteobacteria bacterium]
MDVIEAIRTRRSIRRFKRDPVPPEAVRQLLEAMFVAPSAGDQRPWHFVVLDDRATLDAVPAFHPHARMLLGAPLAILVCGDPSLETHKGYWVQDCGAATENLLLAAHGLGLGACWLGVHTRPAREQGLRDLLGIPEHVVPYALVAIGVPDEPAGFEDRWDDARIHRNRW